MKTKLILFVLSTACVGGLWGQDTIKLRNPSFEADEPGAGITPKEWLNLGPKDQTPPDIQPGFFGVDLPAKDGKVYLGLAVRENNTWEGVGQGLDGTLKRDSIYSFSLWLARSNKFTSYLAGSSEPARFNAPTVLKIWGYNSETHEEELLGESQPLSHSQWMRFDFVLKPTYNDFHLLELVAYYAPGHEQKNGHLLIDHCSDIVKIKR